MKKEIHIGTGIIGSVVSLLEIFLMGENNLGYSILLMTIMFNIYYHLILEWRYYKRHDAVIASSQFLLIPYTSLLFTNYLGNLGLLFMIFTSSGIIRLEINIFSLIVSPLYLLSTVLTKRFYQRRYTGFVLKYKVHGPVKWPLFLHTTAILAILGIVIYSGYIDIVNVLFVITYIFQTILYLIKPRFDNPYDDSNRRNYMNSLTPSRSNRITPSTSRSTRPSERGDTSARGKKKRKSISTTPAEGYREIPTRSRNAKNSRDNSSTPQNRRDRSTKRKTRSNNLFRSNSSSKSSNSSRVNNSSKSGNPSRSIGSVSGGIEIMNKPKAVKRKNKLDPNLLPSGNVSKDDLKCMVCYQNFRKNKDITVALCPHCKYPAHEEELNQWLLSSPQCPRCAKNIKTTNTKKLRVREDDYVKMIGKL